MKKPLFNKICIVGVGLIGGSLGLVIKKHRLAKLAVGVVRRKRSAIEAVQTKAVDMATLKVRDGVRDADLVILCAPVSTIVNQLKQISPFLKKNAIVMDVGSSKVEINRAARRFLKKNEFVGCHPMAGSKKCGIEFADGRLFEKSICFMTRRNQKIARFWKALGAEPMYIKEGAHDAWVAKSSHLPHVLSFSLFQNMDSKYSHNPSLKDLARLAASNPDLWTDIFLSNQKQVLRAIGEFQKSLSDFQKALRAKNKTSLTRFILHANKQAS